MKLSAGILLYRYTDGVLEFFLVHPGGPFFKNKNEGWWTIPKGEFADDELPFNAALREFEEETGYAPKGDFIQLRTITQKAGKSVMCWAVKDDLDAEQVVSNEFEMQWPPRSGQIKSFPEIDKAGWFALEQASKLINEQQVALLEELNAILNSGNQK